AHLWNDAETAGMIAAFGDFYVSGMRWCEPKARRVVIRNVPWPRSDKIKFDIIRIISQHPFDNRAELVDLIEPDKCIDLGQRNAHFLRKALRHAATHDQFLIRAFAQAALLVRLQDRLDRFFFS